MYASRVALKEHITNSRPAALVVCAILSSLLLFFRADPANADLESGKLAYQQRHYADAFTDLLPLAEQGDPDAQVYVGLMYATGRAVDKDLLAAARWYRLAADQGHRDAQFNLGLMYAKGLGVPMNYAAAVMLYRQAAEQDHAGAQLNLGVCYSRGYGVLRDEAMAAHWFERAANQGNAAAQFNLGLLYAEGRGVPQDSARAAELYRRAAEQGHTAAQLNLGVCFERGIGLPVDLESAANWYRLAAANGDADARFNLARLESREDEHVTTAAATKPAVVAPRESAPGMIEEGTVRDGRPSVAAIPDATDGEAAVAPIPSTAPAGLAKSGKANVGEIVTQVDAVVDRVDTVVDDIEGDSASNDAAPGARPEPAGVASESPEEGDEMTIAWRNRGFLPRAAEGTTSDDAVP